MIREREGDTIGNVHLFSCDRWFDDHEDDGETARDIALSGALYIYPSDVISYFDEFMINICQLDAQAPVAIGIYCTILYCEPQTIVCVIWQ